MHIAVIGSGQLAQMLAEAGKPLGLRFSFLAEEQEDTRCVDHLGGVVRSALPFKADQVYNALSQPDVITVEKESVDVELLRNLQDFCRVHPAPEGVFYSQNRSREKQLLDKLAIKCTPYTYQESLIKSEEQFGLPLVIKSCEDGYDGKNQYVIKTPQERLAFEEKLANNQLGFTDFIVEAWMPFDKEVSQVSARDAKGNFVHYTLTENQHSQGILRLSYAPAQNISPAVTQTAQANMQRLMEELNYVGVMAMECFLVGENLFVNELAPRVHNSGHWTQKGALTSQFENHVRAIAGLSLGESDLTAATAMINLIGIEQPKEQALPFNSRLHWYGKTVRAGRKLGHINCGGVSLTQAEQLVKQFL